MFDFEYSNPTKIIFGKGSFASLKQQLVPYKKIMLLYGTASIKKYGILEQVKQQLSDVNYIEFSGITANPEVSYLLKAIELAREHQVDFLLAVGGGSVIDAAKMVAAGVCCQKDIWQVWCERKPLNRALPLGCIVTLSATGSEMNCHSVISNSLLKRKTSHSDPWLFPKFAILNPVVTYSLPAQQIGNGVVDTFVHVCEQYLAYPVDAKIQDRYAEGILLTLIEEGPKALKEPENYDVRANLMWSATQALNQLIGLGVPQDWASHAIGHQITALYQLEHAQTLAVILPALLQVLQLEKSQKLLQYAQRVWGIQVEVPQQALSEVILRTKAFFINMGLPVYLKDYGLAPESVETIIEHIQASGILPLGENDRIDVEKLREILHIAYQP